MLCRCRVQVRQGLKKEQRCKGAELTLHRPCAGASGVGRMLTAKIGVAQDGSDNRHGKTVWHALRGMPTASPHRREASAKEEGPR